MSELKNKVLSAVVDELMEVIEFLKEIEKDDVDDFVAYKIREFLKEKNYESKDSSH